MMIAVASRHFKNCRRDSALQNPLALAIQEQLDPHAVVTLTKIHLCAEVHDVPPYAQAWLRDCRAGLSMTSLTIELKAPVCRRRPKEEA